MGDEFQLRLLGNYIRYNWSIHRMADPDSVSSAFISGNLPLTATAMAPIISALSPKEEENVKEVLGMRCRAACRPYLQGKNSFLKLSLCRFHRVCNRTDDIHGMGMSAEEKENDGMHTGIVRQSHVLTDLSDTMENRDKAREIYIKQRELFIQEEREKKEEAAKDKAWMREKAGLPPQTGTPPQSQPST